MLIPMMPSSTTATPLPRRAVSLQSPRPLPSPSSPDPQVEILHTVPSTRIVAFETARNAGKRTSVGGNGVAVEHEVEQREVGGEDWVSRFERTIAVGPLRIYRAPGSVAFLSCSNALRPILPKSQCWEVEPSSIFVLQIRPPQYWRIELPNKTPDEQRWVESFRDVLGKVLLFEKTPCPFKRTFTVQLPEPPQTPIKKKPWRPVERSSMFSTPFARKEHSQEDCPATPSPASSLPLSPAPLLMEAAFSDSTSEATSSQKADCLSPVSDAPSSGEPSVGDGLEDSQVLRLQDSNLSSLQPPLVQSRLLKSSALETSLPTEPSNLDDQITACPQEPVTRLKTPEPEDDNIVPVPQKGSRSATAPAALTIITTSPSARTPSPLRTSSTAESDYEFSSSVDSFHSVQSWHSPLAPPSPPASGPSSPISTYPYPHDNIKLPKRPNYSRDASELTATPQSHRVWDVSGTPDNRSLCRSTSPPPKTPTLISSSSSSPSPVSEVLTPHDRIRTTTLARTATRHRTTTSSNSRRRELSPLPAAVNLFSPKHRRSRHLQTARHLPTAIVQKTCEILMSPPSHLLQLMMSIATRIASGEWRGWFSGGAEEDGTWDYEGEEYVVVGGEGNGETVPGTGEQDGWMEEDDFGVNLNASRGRTATRNKNKGASTARTGGSWEVD